MKNYRKNIARAAAALLAVLLIPFSLSGCAKAKDYDQAVAAMENGEYESAREVFLSLGDYRGSEDYAGQCYKAMTYNEGVELYGSGKYEDALTKFEELGNYEDSGDYGVLCRAEICKQDAREAMDGGRYEDALELLNSAEGTLMDSAERRDLLEECKLRAAYDEADKAYSDGLFYTAYTDFDELGSFSDSEERRDMCVQSRPGTGEVYHDPEYSGINVYLRIKTPDDDNCTFLKFYDISGESEVLALSVFIEPGKTATVRMPSGSYRIKAAYGSGMWFGDKEMFGKDGQYTRLLYDGSSDIFDIRSGSYALTLISVANGNVGAENEDMSSF